MTTYYESLDTATANSANELLKDCKIPRLTKAIALLGEVIFADRNDHEASRKAARLFKVARRLDNGAMDDDEAEAIDALTEVTTAIFRLRPIFAGKEIIDPLTAVYIEDLDEVVQNVLDQGIMLGGEGLLVKDLLTEGDKTVVDEVCREFDGILVLTEAVRALLDVPCFYCKSHPLTLAVATVMQMVGKDRYPSHLSDRGRRKFDDLRDLCNYVLEAIRTFH